MTRANHLPWLLVALVPMAACGGNDSVLVSIDGGGDDDDAVADVRDDTAEDGEVGTGVADAGDAGDAETDAIPSETTVTLREPVEGAVVGATADFEITYQIVDHPLELGVSLRLDGAEVASSRTSGSDPSGVVRFASVDLERYAGIRRPVFVSAALTDDGEIVAVSSAVSVQVETLGDRLSELAADPRRGVRFERGRIVSMRLDEAFDGATPVERAWSFLHEWADALGFTDVDKQLVVSEVVSTGEDGGGYSEDTVAFRQVHGGVPVYGSDVRLHFVGDELTYVLANHADDLAVEDPAFDVRERIDVPFEEARRTAARHFARRFGQHLGLPSLIWFNDALVLDPLERDDSVGESRLAWQLRVSARVETESATTWEVVVDATTGDVLDVVALDLDADVEIWDANGHSIGWTCGTIFDPDWGSYESVCTESSCDSGAHPEAEPARSFSVITYDWYRSVLGRRSWDNDNEQIEAYVDCDTPNAAYNAHCDVMKFRNGWVALEILAHEFTHGVVAHEVNLRYKNASGALNESYADVFGVLVNSDDQGVLDCDIFGMRDLCDPTIHDVGTTGVPYPDTIQEYCADAACGVSGDHGGVHRNSSITNVVAGLLLQGGTHPETDVTVQAIGPDRVARLWYEVLRRDLSKGSGLTRMCIALLERSRTYAQSSAYEFDRLDACAVANSCAAAGFNATDTDCDYILDDVDDDRDGDNRPNTTDNCPDIFNPWQDDWDDDGRGNACDPDIDGDGLLNGADNCPDRVNPDQADLDRNGLGDVCDDGDGDWIYDDEDNCPNTYNSEQFDLDSDGEGDACDPDWDGDGALNGADNCPRIAQAGDEFADDDRDGRGLTCDNCPDVSNPDQADADGRGGGDACDDDDDDDGLLDEDDNCPRDHNVDQFDGDGDGEGFACDREEQAAAFAARSERLFQLMELFQVQQSLGIPLPVCDGSTCDERVGMPQQMTLLFETPFQAEVAVVDQFGAVVTRLRPSAEVGVEFEHAMTGSFAVPAEALSFARSAVPFVGPRYFLLPYTAVEDQFDQEVALTVTVP